MLEKVNDCFVKLLFLEFAWRKNTLVRDVVGQQEGGFVYNFNESLRVRFVCDVTS